MANWETVSRLVASALQEDSALRSYASVAVIDSVADYLNESVAQAVNSGYLVLISPPDGGSVRTEAMLSGIKRRYFYFTVAIVVKNEATGRARLYGERGKGIFEVQEDVERILEHNNFSGAVDNKAGSNFDVEWSKVPLDNRAITVYTTTYTAVRTE